MDEVVGDELTPLDGTEGRRLQSKESEFQRKSESGSMLESRERITTGENEFRETSSLLLVDILDGKNVARSLSSVDPLEHTSVSPHSVDNVGGMVEELTIRNYCNLNLASVGPSNSRVRIGNGGNQWQHIYQTAGGLATHGYSVNREGTGIWEDGGCKPLSEFLSQKSSRDNCNEVVDRSPHSETKETLGDVLVHGGIRTKILSKSGFSEFFVKNTLKGKGIICRGPPSENFFAECKNQNDVNVAHGSKMAADALLSSPAVVDKPAANSTSGTKVVVTSEHEGINMREWISIGHRDLNKVVRLNIFRQIVYLVDYYHSKGIALPDLRPSRFVLLPSNQVKFLGSLLELEGENSGIVSEKHLLGSGDQIILKRAPERGSFYPYNFRAKKQKVNEDVNYAQQWPQFCSKPALKGETASGSEMNATDPQISGYVYCSQKPSTVYGLKKFGSLLTANPAAESLTNATCQLEERWYKSPEEVGTGASQISSNIYCLGVFLFELLGRFDSERARNVAMMDLRHRILPPSFLSENPKEAGFCLWLLHPEPSSRPTSRGILESEVLSELKEVSGEDLSFSIEQDDEESELLMHFLIALKEHKQKSASKLIEDLNCLEADIEEIGRRRHAFGLAISPDLKENKFYHEELVNPSVISHLSPLSCIAESRWMGNMGQLETAYFSMRYRMQHPETDNARRADNDALRNRENWYLAHDYQEKQDCTDRVGSFFDGLCKYARYNKFAVRGVLRNGEFNSSANVICSLSFDRDEDYFATAGISKKIKIFEFDALFNQSVDIHYPVIEMSNRSKLSCICWNNYIRNYLASTDYDGVVKLWDASTGQGLSEFSEHEKRAWSVDFSPVYPTKLASGSDDCSVKLWSINERSCLGTIRNKANVCCVQFSAHSTHLLAFGSADYRTYCYDLRNARIPWCILTGHEKAVSYVKFMDSETVITASTDNTLKLWDLNKTNPSGLSSNACSLTFRGHTNEKNFVGLSVANGYITCGSETNEVFAYHRSLPMPITSYKFGSIDPISGKETDDDNGQFVSSVCWRRKSDMIVAANSSGCIKVLEML